MAGTRLAFAAAQSTLAVALVFLARASRAEPPAPAQSAGIEPAAAAYDAGVKAFENADFVLAARQFLRADALVPNTDALYNALLAAQRGKDDALIATAAARAAAREASAPALAKRARKSLAEVEPRVARFVLACEPAPCELAIDGKEALAGTSYALPGTHLVTAHAADGSLAERTIEAVAGSEHVIALELEQQPAARSAETPAPEPFPERHSNASPAAPEAPNDRSKPFSPPIVYVGAGITLALAAATTWSGIDTLKAKNRLPGTESDNDAVLARAHRTDALLLGTVVAGAATATIGLVWTDWDGKGSRVALRASLDETTALVGVAGTY
ncbi:MAG TPA: hypothetical protein VF103_13585 [Polyangiaceae bacterium]